MFQTPSVVRGDLQIFLIPGERIRDFPISRGALSITDFLFLCSSLGVGGVSPVTSTVESDFLFSDGKRMNIEFVLHI